METSNNESLIVSLPSSDVQLLRKLARKMGWKAKKAASQKKATAPKPKATKPAPNSEKPEEV